MIAQNNKKFTPGQLYMKFFSWINIGLVFLIILIGSFLILKPEYEKIRAEEDSLAVQEEYQKIQKELSLLQNLEKNYKAIPQSDKDKINNIIPNEENFEKLFPIMETLINRNGLMMISMKVEDWSDKRSGKAQAPAGENFQDFSPTNVKNDDEVKIEKLPSEVKAAVISLEVGNAGYANLKSLLSNLENSLRLMDVLNISFTPENKASLKIATYYLKK